MVSTVVVPGRRFASATGMKSPVLESRPILVALAAIVHLLPKERPFADLASRAIPAYPKLYARDRTHRHVGHKMCHHTRGSAPHLVVGGPPPVHECTNPGDNSRRVVD